MSAFEHVLILLSFVYALALTHLLSRMIALYVARTRVVFSGLLTIAMVNSITIVFCSWLALWPFRSIKDWDLYDIVVQFFYSVCVYFLCALAAPELPHEGTVDLENYYWRHRQSFYGVYLLTALAGIAGNFSYLKTSATYEFLAWNIASVIVVLPALLAIAVKARWAQWSAGLLLTAMWIATGLFLEPKLS
jgi:hypothetical protein